MSAKTSTISETRKKVSQARKHLKKMTLEERLELMVAAKAMTPAQAILVRKQAAKNVPTPARVVSAPRSAVSVPAKVVVVRSKPVSALKKQATAKGGNKG